jgi:protein-disulfide isomerase
MLEQVLKKYPQSVKLVFKNFPLRNHRFAAKAAAAALAANRQGKFWEFYDELFKNYNRLSDKKISEIARKLGLNEAQFKRDRKDPLILAKIRKDYQEGMKLGVKGIPTVFVNGRRVRSRSVQGFQAIIERELKKLKASDKGNRSGR